MTNYSQILDKIVGLTIRGIVSYSQQQKLVLIFEDNTILTFKECPLFVESGVIGNPISIAKVYSGEMGLMISLKEMGLNGDEYECCYICLLKDIPFSQKASLRIVFKDIIYNTPQIN